MVSFFFFALIMICYLFSNFICLSRMGKALSLVSCLPYLFICAAQFFLPAFYEIDEVRVAGFRFY